MLRTTQNRVSILTTSMGTDPVNDKKENLTLIFSFHKSSYSLSAFVKKEQLAMLKLRSTAEAVTTMTSPALTSEPSGGLYETLTRPLLSEAVTPASLYVTLLFFLDVT